MIREILEQASRTAYDFRNTAHPRDPLAHLFEEWVDYYRLKWAISRVLQPRRILEIGVRFGYSAAAFLDASPEAEYLGIDNDSDTFGGQRGAIDWARRITGRFHAQYVVADSQDYESFPGGTYDLVHIDGQQDGAGSIRDLKTSLGQARHILLDGYLWTRENFLHVSEFLCRYRDVIESWTVIPGYAGELLIAPRPTAAFSRSGAHSRAIRHAYTSSYYLSDCGGYDAYKRDKGLSLSDRRLQVVATLAETAPVGRALDLGCGRGELSVHLARLGHSVLAVDYSESAIALARNAAGSVGRLPGTIAFHCGDVTHAPLSGAYDVAVASDLIEHMAPGELDELYARIAAHLSERGRFVIHTFPNVWHYTYGHPRIRRQARKLGAYVPLEPRTRFEELMHINEQSPRVLRRQLRRHFPHVLLWFAEHSLEAPFENLRRSFSVSEMRQAGDLFAVASHSAIGASTLREAVSILPVSTVLEVVLEVLECPATVAAGSRFQVLVRLTNSSGVTISSGAPNPVHLSYHWLGANGQVLVFEGRRTRLPVMQHGAAREVPMDLEAPLHGGALVLRATLVQEGVRWFDAPPQSLSVDRAIQVVSAAS